VRQRFTDLLYLSKFLSENKRTFFEGLQYNSGRGTRPE
jgi:hypothetical protein